MERNNPRNISINEYWGLKKIEDKIKFFLKFAILAPSTHNSQPWLFRVRNNTCHIFYDPNLKIPKADPTGRDLHISIGCATANLCLAAKSFGLETKINIEQFTQENKLVEVVFSENRVPKKMFDPEYLEVMQRRINARGEFLSTDIPQDIFSNLEKVANEKNISLNIIKDKERIDKMAELTVSGLKLAYKDPDFRKEMSSWIHNSLSSKKYGLPGYALKMPLLLSFILPTIIKYVDIGKKLAQLNSLSLKSSRAIVVLSTEENTPQKWIEVGIAAEMMMLEVNKKNYNTSIFVASIEMGDTYKYVQKLLDTIKRPQFVFVIGKIDSLHKPTPRYSLKQKII